LHAEDLQGKLSKTSIINPKNSFLNSLQALLICGQSCNKSPDFQLLWIVRKISGISLILACLLSSCIHAPEYSIIPHIKFVSVSSQYVTSGNLDTITFSFTDGDGDIAPNDNYPSVDTCIIPGKDSTVIYKNYNNIFLFPSNSNFGCQIPDAFASPNLVPAGTYKALSGQIQVYETVHTSTCFTCLGDTCASPSGTGNDSVIYTIYLIDLAGHLSNSIQTTAIYTGCH